MYTSIKEEHEKRGKEEKSTSGLDIDIRSISDAHETICMYYWNGSKKAGVKKPRDVRNHQITGFCTPQGSRWLQRWLRLCGLPLLRDGELGVRYPSQNHR